MACIPLLASTAAYRCVLQNAGANGEHTTSDPEQAMSSIAMRSLDELGRSRELWYLVIEGQSQLARALISCMTSLMSSSLQRTEHVCSTSVSHDCAIVGRLLSLLQGIVQFVEIHHFQSDPLSSVVVQPVQTRKLLQVDQVRKNDFAG